MARTDEEKLVLALEARITDFEKGLERARKTTNDKFKKMTDTAKRNSSAMETAMKRSVSGINGALGKLGVGLGVSALGAAVLSTTRKFADLGREAKRAGVGVEDFQKWRYVAETNGVAIDSMADSFKELNMRANEYAETGKGSAAEAFAALGMSPAEVKERLKNPSELMMELIDRTRRLKDTAKGIRLFDEMFGGGGEQFVSLIEQGRAGVEATIKEAEELGVVLGEDMVQKAEEIDKKFNQIATTVGSALKGAIVEAVNALTVFINEFYAFEDRSKAGLVAKRDQLLTRRKQLEHQAGSTEDKVLGWVGKDAATELKAVDEQLASINDELERRNKLIKPTVTEDPVKPFILPTVPDKPKGRGATGRDKAAAEAQREAEAVRKLIADLEFERSLIGKSAVEKEKMNALRHAGKAATAEEKAQIGLLVEAIYKEQEALDAAQQRLIDINDNARYMTGNLVSGILEGRDAADLLSDALMNVSNVLLNDVLDSIFKVNNAGGGGILGGLLGGLLGGGQAAIARGGGIGMYAKGTNYAPGGAAIVGEEGPELVNLPRGSQVVPNNRLGSALAKMQTPQIPKMAMVQNSRQSVDVTTAVQVSVDQNGNLKAFVQEEASRITAQGIQRSLQGAHFENTVARSLQNAQKRGVLR